MSILSLRFEDNTTNELTVVAAGVTTSSLAAMGGSNYGLHHPFQDEDRLSYVTVDTGSDAYWRSRLYFNPNFLSLENGETAAICGFCTTAVYGGKRGTLTLQKTAGVLQLKLEHTSLSVTGNISEGDSPVCVELEIFKDTSGHAKLWINDVLIGTASGNISGDSRPTRFYIGTQAAHTTFGGLGGDTYFDEIEIRGNSTYIGSVGYSPSSFWWMRRRRRLADE